MDFIVFGEADPPLRMITAPASLARERAEHRKTPLYDEHVRLGAKMVPFAGWLMPVQYTSIVEEHLAVRNNVGVFDISHMGQFIVDGAGGRDWLNSMLTNNVDKLDVGMGQYTFLLNDRGGIIDDLIVYRIDEQKYLLVVIHLACDLRDITVREQWPCWINSNAVLVFWAFPGLIRIVIGFTALVYVLVYLNRGFESFLTLDPALILRGQVWRLVTYIFHSADVQSTVGASRALVSLVHRRRSRTRVGVVPTDALFRRRDDWHDHRGIPFRQQFLQWHGHHVIVLRIRAILSR